MVGCPSMPQKQNLRGIIATMPRVWGLEGLVHGRVMEGRRFQFIFPSEEAMDTVFRRGLGSVGLCRQNVNASEMDYANEYGVA